MIDELVSHLEKRLKDVFSEWSINIVDNRGINYSLAYDSKIISKLFELTIEYELKKLESIYDFETILSKNQVKYPDFSIRFKQTGEIVALDVKSSYRVNNNRISGFTLGSYQGSIKNKESQRYSVFPYASYTKHYCICVIYTKTDRNSSELLFPVRDIDVWIREKYAIASDKPGSGNTKNIGSVTLISDIINSNGIFAPYGQECFQRYWANFVPGNKFLR